MIQGDRLRRLREQAAMTQTRLGALIGQDQQYVSKLERGTLRGMTVETLERLCRALQVSTDYLLDFSYSTAAPSTDMRPMPRRRHSQAVPRPPGRDTNGVPEQPGAAPVAVLSPPEPPQSPPMTHRASALCPYCAIPLQPLGDEARLACRACRYSREA